jgi:hypothetical protein
MKKSCLCTFGICLLGALAVQAAPILAPPVAQCSTLGTGSANNLTFTYATWSAATFACEQQDKIYSNFSVGAIPIDTTLSIQLQPLGLVDFHTVTFNGNFGTNFLVSYDIAIDLFQSPKALITLVTGDLSNPSNLGTPSNTKTVFSEAGVMLGSLTSLPAAPGSSIATFNTALHVTDNYLAGAGAAVSISNTFREDLNAAPETFSYALVGGGFLLLASLRRIRRT